MSPIIISLVDFWIFLQLAKIAFFIGFLRTYQETKNGKLKRSDLIWPMLSLSIGTLWLVLWYFWPTENRSAMALIILSISSHATGSFIAINANVKTTKRSKAVTIFSMMVSAILVIIMTATMSQIKPPSTQTIFDYLVFAGVGIGFGLGFYQMLRVVNKKTYEILEYCLLAIVTTSTVALFSIPFIILLGDDLRYINTVTLACNVAYSLGLAYSIFEKRVFKTPGYIREILAISVISALLILIFFVETIFISIFI